MQKQIKFALTVSALLLGAPALAVPITGNTLSGKIVDWPADLKNTEMRLTSWFSEYTAAKGPVEADGTFKLTLNDLTKTPDKLVKTSELFTKNTVIGDVCKGQGKATPDTASFQFFMAEVWVAGEYYGGITLDNSVSFLVKKGDAEANVMYFSEATELSGSAKCPAPYDNSYYKGVYPAGWSLVRGELSLTPAGAYVYDYDSAAPLTGLSWRLFKEYGRVGLNVDYETGRITAISAGLPAEKAGLKVGDVIVSVDGKPLLESGGLRGEPDSKVVLVVKRDGQEMTFEVTRVFTRWP